MGAGGFGTLASHFTDRTVVTYDPRGVERSVKADPASQSTPEQHADDLHRIIADARRRSGRPVREQRRRGQRARPGGRAPGGRADARRARAAAGVDPARSRGAMAFTQAIARHVPAQRVRPGDGAVHPRRQPPGADHRRASPPRPHRIRRCSGCRPRTTASGPTRCCSRTSSPAPTTSRTSMLCARRRPGSSSPPASSRRVRWRIAARRSRPSVSARDAGLVPERPRRLPRWRVRPGRRPGRLRGEAARGPRRSLTACLAGELPRPTIGGTVPTMTGDDRATRQASNGPYLGDHVEEIRSVLRFMSDGAASPGETRSDDAKYVLIVDFQPGVVDTPMEEWQPEEVAAHLDYYRRSIGSWSRAASWSSRRCCAGPTSPRS